MKKIFVWSVFGFLLLFVAAPLAYPEPKPPMDNTVAEFQLEGSCFMPPMMPCDMEQMRGMPEPGHHPFARLRGLNLDEKQKDALKEMENDAAKDLIRKRADEQIAQIELGELLEKDTVDLKAVEKKLKQIEALKMESQFIVIKSVEKMKTKLTTGQLKMLKKIKPMGHPGMRLPMTGEMMHDQTKMPPPSARERGE
jgi:Spy/CpxP family protein refolding chaperone